MTDAGSLTCTSPSLTVRQYLFGLHGSGLSYFLIVVLVKLCLLLDISETRRSAVPPIEIPQHFIQEVYIFAEKRHLNVIKPDQILSLQSIIGSAILFVASQLYCDTNVG